MFGHERCAQTVLFQRRVRCQPHRGDLHRGRPVAPRQDEVQTALHGIDADEHGQVEGIETFDQRLERGGIFGRANLDGGKFDRQATQCHDAVAQTACLRGRTRHQDARFSLHDAVDGVLPGKQVMCNTGRWRPWRKSLRAVSLP